MMCGEGGNGHYNSQDFLTFVHKNYKRYSFVKLSFCKGGIKVYTHQVSSLITHKPKKVADHHIQLSKCH